jgi:membrane protease subunit HflC
MKSILSLLILVAGVLTAVVGGGSLYTVSETEQIVITQFGKPVGEPVREAGLHFKLPFIQKVLRFDKRLLPWDGPTSPMPTRDKVYIEVNTFARWRISDPRVFLEKLRDERGAISRLNDILGSETRNVIARHDFIEAVRTTKDRTVAREVGVGATVADARIGVLPPIRKGRGVLEHEIFELSRGKVTGFGIELMDVRFKRINYNPSVSQTIYQRMISERTQIAERYKSEGAGEAAKILGQRERDLQTIESEAYRKVQEIEGAADAKATEIYARAYNSTSEARELFEFLKSMETLKKTLTGDTRLVLSTDSDLLRYLKSPTQSEPVPSLSDDPLRRLPSLLDVKP